MFRFDRLVISLEKRALLYQRFSFLFVLVDWETAHCVHCVEAWFGWLTIWLSALHSVMITAGIAATKGTTDGQWGVTLLCVQLAVLERISGCIHKGVKSPFDWFNHVIYSRSWMYGCKLELCVCAHLFVSACVWKFPLILSLRLSAAHFGKVHFCRSHLNKMRYWQPDNYYCLVAKGTSNTHCL